jgi:hypothetical protein
MASLAAASDGNEFELSNITSAPQAPDDQPAVFYAGDNVGNESPDVFHAKGTHAVTTGDGTCNSPILIACGDTVTGDTSLFSNAIDRYSCSGWEETGPEIIYSFTLPAGGPYDVSAPITDFNVDLDLFLLDPAGCAAGQCLNSESFDSSNLSLQDLPAGTYLIAVDGYQGVSGTFTLSLNCVASVRVSWLEVAAHLAGGGGSQWRTDVVVLNEGSGPATVDFILHKTSGDKTLNASIEPSAMGVFEDIVDQMGTTGKGSLEVRSNQSHRLAGRIYNQADSGTFGQFIPGFSEGEGLTVGQPVKFLGLRQFEGRFRTNIGFTNTGDVSATVDVTLHAADGSSLKTYTVNLDPNELFQDIEPFKNRAGQPNLGWGYALVEVQSGNGVLISASVIDSITNDATTIPMR